MHSLNDEMDAEDEEIQEYAGKSYMYIQIRDGSTVVNQIEIYVKTSIHPFLTPIESHLIPLNSFSQHMQGQF
jgi:hypothetical protein